MKHLLAFFMFLTALAALGACAPAPGPAEAAAPAAERHMIVAAERDASEAGLEMLRAGGSAIDAAIAAQLVLTLVEPQSSGIGGSAYIMVSDGDELYAYDGRETAPASVTPELYLDENGDPLGYGGIRFGGISVGVPGTIKVMAMAHRAHGRLAWERLFEPAIRLAEEGFAVPERLADGLARGRGRTRFAGLPDMLEYFYHEDETPYAAGEFLRNQELAETYRLLAAQGEDAFYHGALAQEIADAVSHAPLNPAAFTLSDLENYEAIEREPLCGSYRGYRACSVPPSTSGGTIVLQILGLLEHFPTELLQNQTATSVHLIAEASRLAYADRSRWLGDPDFVEIPEGLLDPTYLNMRASLINPTQSMGIAEAGIPPMQHGFLDYAPAPKQTSFGTSHLAAVDESGQVVSMTMTIQAAYGAGIMPGGFILNNELTDFSQLPEIDGRVIANAPAPGKRPLSSMSPFILFDPEGEFFAALGSPGGAQIIGYTLQGIVSLIDAEMTMQEAAAAPRITNQNGATVIEQDTILEDFAPALTAMGHEVRPRPYESGLNGIRRIPGGYEGGADPRRSGIALGD
jgi:gamma-glutamyltranspeptidase/glutathione hydrolase